MEKRKDFLAYCLPCYDENEINGIKDAITSDWWSRGPKVAEFEKDFCTYVGAKYGVALNSCTAGLHLGLKVLGVGEGDEVITTPMTFCATSNTIVHCGGTPVFADVDPETGLIDPDEIEKKITPKTKGIVPVHYAGRACDMERINAIAKKHGLFVMEDCAHAVYTTYANGKLVGNSDNLCSFSFYATKNLATGEGGMLTTNNEELYKKATVLGLHGMSKNAWNRFAKGGSWRYDVVEAGFKYNMTDPAAALGIAQLKKLEKMQDIRKKYAEIYNAAFDKIDGIDYLPDSKWGRNAWHLYMIKIKKDKFSIDRDEFIEILRDEYNVGISVHYIPVHLHPFYQENFGTKEGDYPKAEAFFDEIISIPLYPSMSEEDVIYVSEAVAEIAQKYAK